MTPSRDVRLLPTLLLSSMTLYGFLLVWAQSDTIELTTISENQRSPISPAGFNILTGRNVTIDLPHWHSTSMMPRVITPGQDTAMNVDKSPTATANLKSATIPLPTAPTSKTRGARQPSAITEAKNCTPGTDIGTTGSASIIPRAIKSTRAATNSRGGVIIHIHSLLYMTLHRTAGRVSIKVKLQSSAPKDEAIKVFLQKLPDVTVTLGPQRTPMSCLKNESSSLFG
ncbi:uncharacterized protein LOC142243884 isoform X2 [Anomaloglossus baeobatrachus]|uniref:uncharacterized protein LOC142243884 isoform X2 n=1 Tax=Anomaloglossus baeobatrachus TaxID=238106 RepID=UPI003F506BBF